MEPVAPACRRWRSSPIATLGPTTLCLLGRHAEETGVRPGSRAGTLQPALRGGRWRCDVPGPLPWQLHVSGDRGDHPAGVGQRYELDELRGPRQGARAVRPRKPVGQARLSPEWRSWSCRLLPATLLAALCPAHRRSEAVLEVMGLGRMTLDAVHRRPCLREVDPTLETSVPVPLPFRSAGSPDTAGHRPSPPDSPSRPPS